MARTGRFMGRGFVWRLDTTRGDVDVSPCGHVGGLWGFGVSSGDGFDT